MRRASSRKALRAHERNEPSRAETRDRQAFTRREASAPPRTQRRGARIPPPAARPPSSHAPTRPQTRARLCAQPRERPSREAAGKRRPRLKTIDQPLRRARDPQAAREATVPIARTRAWPARAQHDVRDAAAPLLLALPSRRRGEGRPTTRRTSGRGGRPPGAPRNVRERASTPNIGYPRSIIPATSSKRSAPVKPATSSKDPDCAARKTSMKSRTSAGSSRGQARRASRRRPPRPSAGRRPSPRAADRRTTGGRGRTGRRASPRPRREAGRGPSASCCRADPARRRSPRDAGHHDLDAALEQVVDEGPERDGALRVERERPRKPRAQPRDRPRASIRA